MPTCGEAWVLQSLFVPQWGKAEAANSCSPLYDPPGPKGLEITFWPLRAKEENCELMSPVLATKEFRGSRSCAEGSCLSAYERAPRPKRLQDFRRPQRPQSGFKNSSEWARSHAFAAKTKALRKESWDIEDEIEPGRVYEWSRTCCWVGIQPFADKRTSSQIQPAFDSSQFRDLRWAIIQRILLNEHDDVFLYPVRSPGG